MAFTVEDGTGVTGANSYSTLVGAAAYHTERGNAAWAAASSDAVREQALVRATDYIEQRWGPLFKGTKEFTDKPLSFPRVNLYDRAGVIVEGIPAKLLAATAEYALRALSAELWLEPVTDTRGQVVIGVRNKVGPIETELRYQDGGSVTTVKAFPEADRLLQEYVASGNSVMRA